MKNKAIINPVKGKYPPELGGMAVMVSSQTDLDLLCKEINLNGHRSKHLMMSKIHYHPGGISIGGPVVGAPYAVMLLEPLVCWGVKKIIFLGWCGSISHDVHIGDIIVPTGAVIDEGTSKHYQTEENEIVSPPGELTQAIKQGLKQTGTRFHEGMIWSTDAIYRETPEKVKFFQSKNVLGVEMEMSALFTVGAFRNVEVGGVLIVSDELAELKWRPGFQNERFQESRIAAVKGIHHLCQTLKL